MKTKESKILSKIRKLLAKANNPAATENEVEIFSRKAQKLMIEYNIAEEKIDLNVNDFGDFELFDEHSINYEKESFARRLVNALCKQYMCKLLLNTIPGGRVVSYCLVGTSQNVTLVKETYNILVEKFRSLAEPRYKEYYKKTKNQVKMTLGYWDAKEAEKMGMIQPRRIWIPSYLLGCAVGLEEQIAQETNENLTDVEKKAKYELIVVKHTDLINEYIKEKYGKLKHTKSRRSKIHGGAYHEGRVDGKINPRTKLIG